MKTEEEKLQVLRDKLSEMAPLMKSLINDPNVVREDDFMKAFRVIDRWYHSVTAPYRIQLKKEEWPEQVLYEKYRAKTLDEFICSSSLRATIQSWIDGDGNFPHLILASKESGTGKTTLVKILANAMYADLWFDNPRTKGIDGIREGCREFLRVQAVKDYKFVCLDEADGASNALGDLLKTLIEETADLMTPTRFFFTTNHLNKLNNALRSRCRTIELANDHRENEKEVKGQMAKLVLKIMRGEGIPFLNDDGTEMTMTQMKNRSHVPILQGIVNQFFPDMRDMINFIAFNNKGISNRVVNSATTDIERVFESAARNDLDGIRDFAQNYYHRGPEIVSKITSNLNDFFAGGTPMAMGIRHLAMFDMSLATTTDARVQITNMFTHFIEHGCMNERFHG